MKRWILLGWMGAVLVFINVSVARKEILLNGGTVMYLRLAPVDPRSLMQGDYMALNYEMARKVPSDAPRDGRLVVSVDARHVAEFVRLGEGEAMKEGERLLRYRIRRKRVKLGAESFFFAEGTAHEYDRAKYGELRVTEEGDSVLVGLADENLKRLGPGLK